MKPERFSSGNCVHSTHSITGVFAFNEAGAFQLRKLTAGGDDAGGLVVPSMKPERFSSGNWIRTPATTPGPTLQ